MISDITLGQYFPQKSPLHATDPRLKICLLVYAIVLILVMLATNNPTLWNFIARVREERQEKKEGAKQ